MRKHFLALTIPIICGAFVAAGGQTTRTIVYDGIVTEVSVSDGVPNSLWITTGDLTRATRFVIKPQGVCRDELCFPLPKNRKSEFIMIRGMTTLFNLSEFAKLINQPFVTDQKNGISYFGPRAAEQNQYLVSLSAPNFTLPDLNGKLHSLSDFRVKKVLLVTWASW